AWGLALAWGMGLLLASLAPLPEMYLACPSWDEFGRCAAELTHLPKPAFGFVPIWPWFLSAGGAACILLGSGAMTLVESGRWGATRIRARDEGAQTAHRPMLFPN